MVGFDEYKPVMAMVALQFSYAGVVLITRAALLEGMNPRVFVVYRQAIATLAIAPIAYFSRRKSGGCSMGLRNFVLIFSASLFGVAINQNVYVEGLYLASSSIASAMANLIPAVTFAMATFLGLENVQFGSLRSIAKILGTILCVGGAMVMTFVKGPKLLNFEHINYENSVFGSDSEKNWLLGSGLLFASCVCWSIWLILQVPITTSYPDYMSLSAWMCFMGTIQSATITLFFEPNLEAWKFSSALELGSCFFTGIVGSAISFIVQAWCISQRGPLFSAMFNPLSTVIVTTMAALFLREKIYVGGFLGAIGIIIGLYILLWGKAKDIEEIKEEFCNENLQNSAETRRVENCSVKSSFKTDLEELLLSE